MESLPYDVILILRLLLLRETNTEDWKSFISLASLLEDWKKMDPWEKNQLEKIKIIREDLGLTQFSHHDILTVGQDRPSDQVLPRPFLQELIIFFRSLLLTAPIHSVNILIQTQVPIIKTRLVSRKSGVQMQQP